MVCTKSGTAGARFAGFASELGAAQPADKAVDVFRDDHESVPAAGLGFAACGSSAAGARRAEVEGEIIENERGKLAGVVHVDLERELVAIKRDRAVNVRHDVADGCHGPCSSRRAK
jgi:hypothetical protein